MRKVAVVADYSGDPAGDNRANVRQHDGIVSRVVRLVIVHRGKRESVGNGVVFSFTPDGLKNVARDPLLQTLQLGIFHGESVCQE